MKLTVSRLNYNSRNPCPQAVGRMLTLSANPHTHTPPPMSSTPGGRVSKGLCTSRSGPPATGALLGWGDRTRNGWHVEQLSGMAEGAGETKRVRKPLPPRRGGLWLRGPWVSGPHGCRPGEQCSQALVHRCSGSSGEVALVPKVSSQEERR